MKGLAYPTSQVSLLKDGQIVATTTSDPGAAFNIQLSNLASGTYSFGVYSVDADGPASRAGVRSGDVLAEIDGVSITSTDGGRRFSAASNASRSSISDAFGLISSASDAAGRDASPTASIETRARRSMNHLKNGERSWKWKRADYAKF